MQHSLWYFERAVSSACPLKIQDIRLYVGLPCWYHMHWLFRRKTFQHRVQCPLAFRWLPHNHRPRVPRIPPPLTPLASAVALLFISFHYLSFLSRICLSSLFLAPRHSLSHPDPCQHEWPPALTWQHRKSPPIADITISVYYQAH